MHKHIPPERASSGGEAKADTNRTTRCVSHGKYLFLRMMTERAHPYLSVLEGSSLSSSSNPGSLRTVNYPTIWRIATISRRLIRYF